MTIYEPDEIHSSRRSSSVYKNPYLETKGCAEKERREKGVAVLKKAMFLVLFGFNSTEEIAKTAEDEEDQAVDIASERGRESGSQAWNGGRESVEV